VIPLQLLGLNVNCVPAFTVFPLLPGRCGLPTLQDVGSTGVLPLLVAGTTVVVRGLHGEIRWCLF